MTQRLVVLAPNWLGDAVMALPAFADIRRHFASAHVAVAARPAVAPLFTMVDGVDDVITLQGGGGLRGLTGGSRDVEALSGGSLRYRDPLPQFVRHRAHRGQSRHRRAVGIRDRLARLDADARHREAGWRAASTRLLSGADDGVGDRSGSALRARAAGSRSSTATAARHRPRS